MPNGRDGEPFEPFGRSFDLFRIVSESVVPALASAEAGIKLNQMVSGIEPFMGLNGPNYQGGTCSYLNN
jgi:hypothetical protein